MFLSLLFALAGGGRAHRAPRPRWPDWQRRTAAGVVAFVLLILALLVAGVPLRMLGWHQWDDLVSGMSQGIGSTPAITVPYRGIDEWVRTAILSGGTALLALAAAARLLAAARRDAGLPDRGRGGPRHPLRRPDRRARSPLALLRRRAVLHPPRRLPVARARPLRPAGGRRDLRGGHRDRRGDHRAAPGQRPAVVRLRELRREARAHEGRGVLVDAQLRAASVVARRARAAAHQDHRARPTGRRPTSTTSTACAGATGPPSRDAARPAAPEPPSGCRPSRSSTAACARRSSSAPATSRTSSRAPRAWRCRRATARS